MAKIHLPVISNNEIFEDFIYDLYNFEYPNDNFQFFGKSSLTKIYLILTCNSAINELNKQKNILQLN